MHACLRLFVPLLAASAFLAAPASAQLDTWRAELRGEEEVPPIQGGGIGSASLVLDPATNQVTVSGRYTRMSTAVAAAHIHGPARRGANGPVILGLQVSGGTSGTLSGTGTLTAQQVQDLRAGLLYFNVHTGANPGGEIRGQIDMAPGTGTGSNAPPMNIDGAATAGGTLNLGCPPGLGSFFVVAGTPGQGANLLPPAACSLPTILAVDPAGPILLSRGPSVSIRVPTSVGMTVVGFQCGQVDINRNCVTLSAGHHVIFLP